MPRYDIELPEPHSGQIAIYDASGRLNAVRCGRRWGKTKQMVIMGADAALNIGQRRGLKVGLFAPEHRQLAEPYDELYYLLRDVLTKSSRQAGAMRLINGGLIDFWALNDNPLAGRGREYDLVMIDEGAFTKNGQMIDIWKKAIRPTMVTRPGARAFVFSTPKGVDPDNFFWMICNDREFGFLEHHAPSSSNPYIPPDELERERQQNHPMIFRQEFLAEFVDWSGSALISEQDLLIEGRPAQHPAYSEYVVAVIDTALKQGNDHDGTAVTYFCFNPYGPDKHQVTILDWDIVSIDGAFLEQWIPSVFARLETLAGVKKSRYGSAGAYIEDAASGIILLQQCAAKGLPAHPIDSKLTSLGKDARVLNILNHTHQGAVKLSEHAYAKTINYKGQTRNHLLTQVTGFRMGDKDAAKRADDLMDTFTYGIEIILGNASAYSKKAA